MYEEFYNLKERPFNAGAGPGFSVSESAAQAGQGLSGVRHQSAGGLCGADRGGGHRQDHLDQIPVKIQGKKPKAGGALPDFDGGRGSCWKCC